MKDNEVGMDNMEVMVGDFKKKNKLEEPREIRSPIKKKNIMEPLKMVKNEFIVI